MRVASKAAISLGIIFAVSTLLEKCPLLSNLFVTTALETVAYLFEPLFAGSSEL